MKKGAKSPSNPGLGTDRTSVRSSSPPRKSGQSGEERIADHDRIAELEAELAVYRHALEQSRQELQAFAYSVSHDLRAPLRAIEGFSKILIEDFGPQLHGEARRFLDHIITNSQHLNSQVEDLLRFYRAGKNPPSKIQVDPNAIVEEALTQAGLRTNGNVSIHRADLPRVWADPTQLREIFVQLLSNAAKFTGKTEQPRIEISARQEPDAVTFSVRDNGAGFDPKHSDRLFHVFQKLHTAAEFPGNGIGLAIVKRLAEAHGGCVQAQGQPGKGATVSFALPNSRDLSVV